MYIILFTIPRKFEQFYTYQDFTGYALLQRGTIWFRCKKKESCFDKWFVATTVSCNTWYKIFNLPHNIQGQRKQYGIQHYIAVAINSDMGDTLPSVATSLSMADNNYSIRDKGNIWEWI